MIELANKPLLHQPVSCIWLYFVPAEARHRWNNTLIEEVAYWCAWLSKDNLFYNQCDTPNVFHEHCYKLYTVKLAKFYRNVMFKMYGWHNKYRNKMSHSEASFTVLVTSFLCDSEKFHSILLKVSTIAWERERRSAMPLLCTTRVDSTKALISWERQILHMYNVYWITRLQIGCAGVPMSETIQRNKAVTV